MAKNSTSMSWFCVINNPEEHGFIGTYKEILEKIAQVWITDEFRACAMTYCVSDAGLHHVHMVLSDDTTHRFSYIKKLYPMAHCEETLGSKRQAEDYIYKKGAFEDSTEKYLKYIHMEKLRVNKGKEMILTELINILTRTLLPRRYSR